MLDKTAKKIKGPAILLLSDKMKMMCLCPVFNYEVHKKKSEWYQKIKRTKMYLRILLPRNPAATLKTYQQQQPATTTKPRSLLDWNFA